MWEELAIKIIGVGGSHMYGYVCHKGGWLGMLRSRLMELTVDGKQRYLVFNCAEPCKTVVAIAAELRTLLDLHTNVRRKFVIVQVGASDAVILCGNEHSEVSLLEFRQALAEITAICAEYGAQPVFVGLPPVDAAYTMPFAPNGMRYGTFDPAVLRVYDAAVRDHARRTGAPFVEVWEPLSQAKANIFSRDRLHLNGRGHRMIDRRVWRVMCGLLKL